MFTRRVVGPRAAVSLPLPPIAKNYSQIYSNQKNYLSFDPNDNSQPKFVKVSHDYKRRIYEIQHDPIQTKKSISDTNRKKSVKA